MVERLWSERNHEQGIFAQMVAGLAADLGEEKTVMTDNAYLKAHRTETSMGVEKAAWPSD